jgi:hypothetical protein
MSAPERLCQLAALYLAAGDYERAYSLLVTADCMLYETARRRLVACRSQRHPVADDDT